MPPSPTTHVIELTPTGRAAVAVVLVSGPDALRCVNECLYRADGRQLKEFAVGRILVGRWGGRDGEELVVCRRSEDEVEVHCHGGVAAVRGVVDLLGQRGCESTSWQNWLNKNGVDPIRAAAQIALAHAPTARTAAVLLDQYQGALLSALHAALNAIAAVEWETAAKTLDAALAQRGVGLHLVQPWRVVLAGRPNVGKSSLMNALVGFQRAIVCDLPGTTRDVVTALTAIDGWPIQLADTAGLRTTRDEIELAGVTRATAAAGAADLVLLVEDAQAGEEISLPSTTRVLRVLNKIDLPNVPPAAVARQFDLRTSAVTGEGIAGLVAAISQTLVPLPPTVGAAVPFTATQVERLEQARSAARERDAVAIVHSLQPFVS